ncbi:peptidase M23 [Streptomyces sp. NPDC088789]|uniref:peptidase M23 n=1 Tax=Streptomyces sp. NPDC088789 TaxID=3365899 RepID=UPI0038029371
MTAVAAAVGLLTLAPSASGRPAASAAARPSVYIWATDVNLRHDGADPNCVFHPSRTCPVVAKVSRTTVDAHCQRTGETVHDLGYSNRWWTQVELADGTIGWVNNLYIRGGEKIAGVPDCAW